MIWRIWHGALLYMYCNYHAGIFPVFRIKMSVRNKLLNQQESGNGKSSQRLGGPGTTANAARSCCPRALGHGDKACSLRPRPLQHRKFDLSGLPSPTRHGNTGVSWQGAIGMAGDWEHVAYKEKLGFQPPGKTLLPSSAPHSPKAAPVIVFFSFNEAFQSSSLAFSFPSLFFVPC